MFRKLHEPTASVTITVDGNAIAAEIGETVAAVLLRLAKPIARTTPIGAKPRAPYCMMGVCFDCLAVVDGIPSTQTCLTSVRGGMRVERQHGPRTVGQ